MAGSEVAGNRQRERRWEFRVGQEQGRLDQFLAGKDTGLTRSRLHALIAEGYATLNGSVVKPSQKVRAGDMVRLTAPPPRSLDLSPEEIPLEILYQDDDIIVLDKPAGLAVHPGPGHPGGTLVNALLALCPDMEGVGGAVRPGIVHRLDKDTSGLMMAAKNERAHHRLSEHIKARQVTKGYLALAVGELPAEEGVIDAPIARDPRHRKRMAVVDGGKAARTGYRVLATASGVTLVELYLESGRTHQIRVHLAHLGHSLLGDAVYGKGSPLIGRQALHAHHLGFEHPVSAEWLEFRRVCRLTWRGLAGSWGCRPRRDLARGGWLYLDHPAGQSWRAGNPPTVSHFGSYIGPVAYRP